jgi:hypothetical protein
LFRRLRARTALDVLDEGPGGARLSARVLMGPSTCRAFPRDWRARAAALGPVP